MKKTRVIVGASAFLLAICGVFTTKANKKKFNLAVDYKITSCATLVTDVHFTATTGVSSPHAAAIVTVNGGTVPILQANDCSTTVYFDPSL